MMRGLIFDVDGVVADSEAVNARASIQVFEELFGLKGVRREDFAAGLGRGAAAYMRAAAEAHGLELSEAQLERAAAARQDRFLSILRNEKLPAFPGVLELMNAALDSEMWRIAIATSSTREKSGAVLASAHIPIGRMVYVCGEDVTHRKPDPELFLTAAHRLGIPAAQCIVVEDAPDGVAAACAAGCACLAVTNSTGAERLAAADRIVDSLEEVNLNELAALLESSAA